MNRNPGCFKGQIICPAKKITLSEIRKRNQKTDYEHACIRESTAILPFEQVDKMYGQHQCHQYHLALASLWPSWQLTLFSGLPHSQRKTRNTLIFNPGTGRDGQRRRDVRLVTYFLSCIQYCTAFCGLEIHYFSKPRYMHCVERSLEAMHYMC